MLALWVYSSFLGLKEKELYEIERGLLFFIVTRAFADA